MPLEDTGVVDLFAGPGGLSCGFKEAGFSIVAAVENDPDSAQTYRRNFSKVRVLGDVKDVHGKELLDVASRMGFQRLLLIGGPPCQPYSLANVHHNTKKHPFASSVSHFVRLVKEIRPEGFLFENVVRFQHLHTWDAFTKDLSHLGYRLSVSRLEAQWFGIPQRRRRLFVAGFLGNAELDFSLLKRRDATRVSDAIQDLPPLPRGGGGKENIAHPKLKGSPYLATLSKRANRLYNHWSTEHSDEVVETIRLIGQGKSLRKAWDILPAAVKRRFNNRDALHSNIYRRLSWRWPSPTIVHARRAMLLHPQQHRIISVREAARLQSFPDRFRFMGTLNSQYQQVANAVPPILAKAIANLIKKLLEQPKKEAHVMSSFKHQPVYPSRSQVERVI